MVLLSGAHQMAKELHPSITKVLDMYRHVHESKGADAEALMQTASDADSLDTPIDDAARPIWEPVDLYGWKIEATFYLQNGQLWWLVHAIRRNEHDPSVKDIALLEKVLVHLGADPVRDMIIGPKSIPDGLPFGWWTWFNRCPLYEIQVNKDKTKKKEMVRIVPLGATESDGYESLDRIAKED